MTFWPLTSYSYFQTAQTLSTNFMTLTFDLHRTTSYFHGAFATVVACQQGTLTRTPGSVPRFGDLLMLELLWPVFPNLPCLFSNFHLEYPSIHSRFCFLLHYVRVERQRFNALFHNSWNTPVFQKKKKKIMYTSILIFTLHQWQLRDIFL